MHTPFRCAICTAPYEGKEQGNWCNRCRAIYRTACNRAKRAGLPLVERFAETRRAELRAQGHEVATLMRPGRKASNSKIESRRAA